MLKHFIYLSSSKSTTSFLCSLYYRYSSKLSSFFCILSFLVIAISIDQTFYSATHYLAAVWLDSRHDLNSNDKWLMSYEAVELMNSLRNESQLKLWNSLIVQRLIFWWVIWCWCVKKIVVICSWLICFLWTWKMKVSFLVQRMFASWTMKKWIRLSKLNMRQSYNIKIHCCASSCSLLFISSIIETSYKSRFHVFKDNNNDTIFICFKKASRLCLCCTKFN